VTKIQEPLLASLTKRRVEKKKRVLVKMERTRGRREKKSNFVAKSNIKLTNRRPTPEEKPISNHEPRIVTSSESEVDKNIHTGKRNQP